ncbi:hypothetical protein BV22DRAFT_1108409 [Leucogyrophana mollusca]|uniref:Uncharacterized protein n=1 Tax=Leucogyrophana mollusca TaxID=85980 RepID=A0ACB8AZ37_9AGAM|nr:hypothetical protein BV22DRAFT_1108409 [Leucogyrophana mollusca]
MSSCQEAPALYRCEDCFGPSLWCQSCVVSNHARNPLHRIKEWNGKFFDRITLKGLGLHVQLGHEVSDRCIRPELSSNDNFVIVDCHGIHEVALNYCACETGETKTTQLLWAWWLPSTVSDPQSAATFAVLEQYHLLSFESKVSAYGFYHSLVRQSDNTGATPIRDRYQAFMRMVREWQHLRMLKRAGRGHDPEGLAAMQPGQCANLPDDWDRVPAKKNDKADPSLGRGWQFFIEDQQFKAHLAEHVDEPQEKSTCSSHNAVNDVDTKSAKGLSATGVGAIDCARHNMKLPNGFNMDYLVFSALKGTPLKHLFISYDIACQWHKKLWNRMPRLAEDLHFNTTDKVIQFLVPKFHLPAHIDTCHTSFSFNFMKGVGHTNREAIERGCANINPVSSSTKAMGPGSRRDTLDDHFADWNWKKVVSLGLLLSRKMKEAVSEHKAHRVILEQLESTLATETLAVYKAEIEEWENDRNNPNPFESKVKSKLCKSPDDSTADMLA